jgi:hypothetical protein
MDGGLQQSNFWRVVCGDIIFRTVAKAKLRPGNPQDELTFVSWSLESNTSPFTQFPPRDLNRSGSWP